MENLENQPQVFHPSHRPWKSLRDSHIPTASTTIPIYKERPKPPPLRINNLGWAKLNCRSGPISVAKSKRAVNAIGSAVGFRPTLYRAPSFSITNRSLWALEILVECGFQYDSSIFPISHDRYGIPGFNRHAQVLRTPAGPIFEVPVATTELMSATIVPVGGGAYMRILPYRYMAAGIRRVNQKEKSPACIYLHPWEIDVDQPRIAEGFVSQMRTYTGIAGMARKLERLVTDFQFAPMSTVYPSPCDAALEKVVECSARHDDQ